MSGTGDFATSSSTSKLRIRSSRTSASPIRGARRSSSRRQPSVSSGASEAATRLLFMRSFPSAAGQVAQGTVERGGVGGDPALGAAEFVQHHEADAVPVFLVSYPG